MPIEYFDTRSSARCRIPTRSSDGVDASPCRRFARGGQHLKVLPSGQMGVEAGLVDDRPDPRQRHVAMLGTG